MAKVGDGAGLLCSLLSRTSKEDESLSSDLAGTRMALTKRVRGIS